jgi:DNA (cytosine-5)-methyltransferase 1
MRHGSLFSGIGGFDLASEWMGWENVFHCEWMEFPRKVLEYHFPESDSLIDICKTDFKKYANTIDILTGGFPCQPFSTAGKRKGTDDERYLWGEMLRAIQEIKPKYVIAENVFGITNIDGGLVFEQVCLDLEAEGYEVQPFIIPAAAKNAPHRRDRVWFVAYANRNDGRSINRDCRCTESKTDRQGQQSVYSRISSTSNEGNATDTKCIGLEYGNETRNIRSKETKTRSERSEFTNVVEANGNGNVTDTNGIGLWGKSDRVRKSTINGQNSATNNWSNFPTESPICSRNDGISQQLDGITFSKWRAESIKGYGNAIVPQVAYELFKQIEKL